VKINLKGKPARVTIQLTEHGNFSPDIQGYTAIGSIPYDKVCLSTGKEDPIKVVIETHEID
jgi:hypothetical protein